MVANVSIKIATSTERVLALGSRAHHGAGTTARQALHPCCGIPQQCLQPLSGSGNSWGMEQVTFNLVGSAAGEPGEKKSFKPITGHKLQGRYKILASVPRYLLAQPASWRVP